MEKVIVIRYGELHLKGKNRGYFERLLIADIKAKLSSIEYRLIVGRGRYIVCDFAEDMLNIIVEKLQKVFGLHSLSIALKCPTELEKICICAADLLGEIHGLTVEQPFNNTISKSFKVETNRADKKFLHNSLQINGLVGEYLLKTYKNLTVDLGRPQITVNIDVRDEGHTFVFCEKIMLQGGMPLNSSGRGMLLLSGGIDSPIAGFLMARRGLNLTALHFHSYPYTNEKAQQKVIDLSKKLTEYVNKMTLINVKMTKIQEALHKHCSHEYAICLLRSIMIRISDILAGEYKCDAIVNGESLGQVASQTLESINVSDSFANLPIFRPLIAMDKQEIIEKAVKIGTFEISALPFEDCCTIFLPEHPVIKPDKKRVTNELNKIENLDELIKEAIGEREVALITNDNN